MYIFIYDLEVQLGFYFLQNRHFSSMDVCKSIPDQVAWFLPYMKPAHIKFEFSVPQIEYPLGGTSKNM